MSRAGKFNAYTSRFESSFLSCEKDTEAIIKKLFVDSRPYSDDLRRLLLVNTSDCLTDITNTEYKKKIQETSLKDMFNEGYIKLVPRIEQQENEEQKSFIVITYDNFIPTDNHYYRDCTIMIDIISHLDCWEMDNYMIRPLKIAGYIDGILNESKLSGIGTLQFAGASEITFAPNLSGYCLIYKATHGADDVIPIDDGEEDE